MASTTKASKQVEFLLFGVALALMMLSILS